MVPGPSVENVYHFFQRACQREWRSVRGAAGEKLVDAEGNSVIFWIEAEGNRISSIHYRCTTCFTLVALCEHLAEMLTGETLEHAAGMTADKLLALHPEIPSMRHERSVLAVDGLRSALARHTEGALA